jgi:hypothetical protein
LPSSPVDDPPDAARAEKLIHGALAMASTFAAAVSAVAWAWIQRGAAGRVAETAVIGLLAVAAALAGGRRLRRIGQAVAVALALIWIAGFYSVQGHGTGPAERLARVPLGRAWLTASILIVLMPHALRMLSSRRRYATAFATLALVSLVVLAVDLYFMPDRTTDGFERGRYHPWLTYDERTSYAYAHAQERRVRDFRGVEFSQHKPAGTTRIVLDGASTLWGHFQDDAHCPGRRLLEYLHAGAPGRSFEVITVARPGKLQLNELIDAAATLPHWQPDLVVSWNGFNEVQYAEADGRYEGEPYIGPQLEASIEASAFEAWAYRLTFVGARLFDRAVRAREGRYRIREREVYEPPRYYAYLRETARLLRSEGIRYAYSFCPNVLEKRSRSREESRVAMDVSEKAPEIAERRRRSSEIVLSQAQISYNAMEPLQQADEALFNDPCHLNQEGVDRSMKDLALRIPEWLRRPTVPGTDSERSPPVATLDTDRGRGEPH